METIITTDERYIKDIKEFNGTLPAGMLNKRCTNVGGTYTALTNNEPYIIAVPTKNLVKNKSNDNENLCGLDGDVANKEDVIAAYLRTREGMAPKFIVTYDTLPYLLDKLGAAAENYNLLCDEYHHLFISVGFRAKAIRGVYKSAKRCKKVTFMSASPIPENFLSGELAALPKTTIEWTKQVKYKVDVIQSAAPLKNAATLINQVLAGTYEHLGKEGMAPVKEVFIFLNSVNSIRTLIKTCGLTADTAKVIVANNELNALKLQGIPISVPTRDRSLNKPITFLTSTAFAGIDLESDSGLTVILSDRHCKQTLLDVRTNVYQILGRLRNEDNPFYSSAVHIMQPQTGKKNPETNKWETADVSALFDATIERIEDYAKQNKEAVSVFPLVSDSLRKLFVRDWLKVADEADTYRFYDPETEKFEYLEDKEKYARYAAEVECFTYKNGLSLVDRYSEMGVEASSNNYVETSKVNLLTIETVDFKTLCNKYIELKEAGDYAAAGRIASQYPLIEEAYSYIGAKGIVSAKYNKKAIADAVTVLTPVFKEYVQSVLPKYFTLGERYPSKEVKEKLIDIYATANVKVKVVAKDLLTLAHKAKEIKSSSTYYYIIEHAAPVKKSAPVSDGSVCPSLIVD